MTHLWRHLQVLGLLLALSIVTYGISAQDAPVPAVPSTSPDGAVGVIIHAIPSGALTFSEFPNGTSITNQYAPQGIIFGGDTPYITSDGANPTSPVLSGTPQYEGAIEGMFVYPADGVTPAVVEDLYMNVGYLDNNNSVRLQLFDASGNVISSRINGSERGIVCYSESTTAIARWRVETVGSEAAGYAIDNVTFGNGLTAPPGCIDLGDPVPPPAPPPVVDNDDDDDDEPTGPSLANYCNLISNDPDVGFAVYVSAGTVPGGDVFCREIVRDTSFLTTTGEIGNTDVIAQGPIQAVDVFGLLPNGSPVIPFSHGVTACLRGSGQIIFFDATDASRFPNALPTTSQGGSTCATVGTSGTFVLVPSGAAAPAAAVPAADVAAPAAAANTSVAVGPNCTLTTQYLLTLRAEPTVNSAELSKVPFDVTLSVVERRSGWARVIFMDMQGWLSEDYVSFGPTC